MTNTTLVTFQKNFVDIQQSFVAKKTETNTFGAYKYRNVEVMLAELKPLLKRCNYHVHFTDEILHVGDRYYVQATATISDGVNEISSKALAREEYEKKKSDASQLTGSASTYARKYALSALLGVDDGSNDPDSKDNDRTQYKRNQAESTAKEMEGKHTTPKASPNRPASPKQKLLLNNLYLQSGGEDGMQKDYIVREGYDPENLSSADASKLIERLMDNAG